jgi:hypothetical protein
MGWLLELEQGSCRGSCRSWRWGAEVAADRQCMAFQHPLPDDQPDTAWHASACLVQSKLVAVLLSLITLRCPHLLLVAMTYIKYDVFWRCQQLVCR